MENKILKSFALIFLALSLISLVSSAEASYCCEKTTNGAWCQNQQQSNCNPNFKMAPTSCDSTSYCKTGCCFDSQEGLCMENTPQKVCEESSGTWAESPSCEIPQCNLGCCVLADQGAFITLTRCRQISGFYGLETDFRKNIADELSCIAVAQQEDKGACVFEDPQSASKTCKFGPRKECPTASYSIDLNATNVTSNKSEAKIGFYKDILCTAEELGTQCAPSTKTMLINGKDEVYWQDTCGNPGNIYDASRYEDHDYWRKVYKKEDSCGAGSSNAGSSTCGNCDYYLGSIGREASRTTGFATYGDYVCLGLNCKAAGKKHGESWCVTDSPTGNGLDTVGSRYYKEVCIYGEVLTEPCADFRNERCIQGQFGSFTEAACRVNRWRDCTAQQEKEDCENYDQRDCHWIGGYYFSTSTNQIEKSTNDSNGDGNANDPTVQGLCMPNYPPGFQFWGSSSITSSSTTSNTSFPPTGNTIGTGVVSNSGASSAICNLGNMQVTFKWVQKKHPIALGFLEKLGGVEREGNWQCNNSYCTTYVPISEATNANISIATAKALATDLNKFCYQLGDCGGYINWIGQATTEGYAEYVNNRRVAGTGGAEILQATSTSSASSSSGSSSGSSAANTASGIAGVINSASQMPSSSTGSAVRMTGNFIKDFVKYVTGGEQ